MKEDCFPWDPSMCHEAPVAAVRLLRSTGF
jgi:hypothetical protein